MRNKYPFSKQEGLKDCAAASLQMIIKYYNGYISIEELNEMLETTKEGTTAFNLVETAKKIGFEAYGIKISLSDIKEANLIFPIIVYTTIDEKYNHFMVIYNIDFKKKKILIADPQNSIKKMNFEEFKKIYNEVSIVLYPIKPIIRKNEVSFKEIMINVLKKYRSEFKFLTILSIFLIVFSISSSFYVKLLFDNYELSKKLLSIIFVMFLIINAFKIVINYMRSYLLILLTEKFSFEMFMDACNKIIYLPYNYYKNRTTGEILSKIVDLERVQDIINKLIVTVFIDLPLALFSIITLLVISNKLFLISLIFLFFYLLIFYLFRKSITKNTDNYYQSRTNYISYLEESISGFESVKNLNLEETIVKNNEKNYIKYLRSAKNMEKVFNVQYVFKEVINNMYDLVVIFIGILFVKNGDMTIGSLLAFNSMQVFFFTPIRNIIDLDLNLIEGKKIIKKLYEMFDKKEINDTKIERIDNIEVRKLTYGDRILNNLNISIKKGEKIMLVGKSGSGKSTFLKLLIGYFEAPRGSIYYNGIDVKDIGNLRSRIVYVSQNEKLFTDSLKNNVCFYSGDFISVAKDFYLEEIIGKNPLGYNMVIEEDGFNISGGQKQRIVLARACMKSFDVLMIDEGLNQIDIALERKILKNLFAKYHDKTIIIVSHRKNNMDLYDRVIKMRKGKVIEA